MVGWLLNRVTVNFVGSENPNKSAGMQRVVQWSR